MGNDRNHAIPGLHLCLCSMDLFCWVVCPMRGGCVCMCSVCVSVCDVCVWGVLLLLLFVSWQTEKQSQYRLQIPIPDLCRDTQTQRFYKTQKQNHNFHHSKKKRRVRAEALKYSSKIYTSLHYTPHQWVHTSGHPYISLLNKSYKSADFLYRCVCLCGCVFVQHSFLPSADNPCMFTPFAARNVRHVSIFSIWRKKPGKILDEVKMYKQNCEQQIPEISTQHQTHACTFVWHY